MDQLAVTGPSVAVEAARPSVMWQVLPAARSLLVMRPLVGQSLDISENGLAAAWTPASMAEEKVWLCWLRLMTVTVRVMATLAVVWMPKSSSLGEKTMASGTTVVEGRLTV